MGVMEQKRLFFLLFRDDRVHIKALPPMSEQASRARQKTSGSLLPDVRFASTVPHPVCLAHWRHNACELLPGSLASQGDICSSCRPITGTQASRVAVYTLADAATEKRFVSQRISVQIHGRGVCGTLPSLQACSACISPSSPEGSLAPLRSQGHDDSALPP